MIEIQDKVHEQYINHCRKILDVPSSFAFRPINWIRQDLYDQLIDIIGDDNFIVVCESFRTFNNDKYMRSDMFISPQGLENLATYSSLTQQEFDNGNSK